MPTLEAVEAPTRLVEQTPKHRVAHPFGPMKGWVIELARPPFSAPPTKSSS